MTDEKITEKKPYVVVETDGSEMVWETNGSAILSDTLNQLEWNAIEALFARHPELVKIWAPYRDPDIIEGMVKTTRKSE